MTGRTHAMIGANAVWLLTPVFNPLLLGLGAFVALLPDLDASESTVKHLQFQIGGHRSRITIKPLWPLAWLFHKLFRHRGWLHSIVVALGVAGGAFLLLDDVSIIYPATIALGYASHLILDALTRTGIEAFLPLRGSYSLLPKPLRIRTGSTVDMLLFIVGALGIVFYSWLHLQAGTEITF